MENQGGEEPLQLTGEKRNWGLTQTAFARLLEWLRGEGQEDGVGYVEIRRRLVDYFDRRRCPMPDELADEVLNRVARRLEEEGTIDIETPAKYCYVVARFVMLEHHRDAQRAQRFATLARAQRSDGATDDENRERTLACLDRCAAALRSRDRDLILQYYAGSGREKIENRRALAARFGISVNALSIRACRIRETIFECVQRCLGG